LVKNEKFEINGESNTDSLSDFGLRCIYNEIKVTPLNCVVIKK